MKPYALCLLLVFGCAVPQPVKLPHPSTAKPISRAKTLDDPAVKLAWDQSPDPSVAGYRVYWGAASRAYTNANTVNGITNTTSTVSNLLRGVTYYFAATCFNFTGLESDFSAEISYAPPPPVLKTNALITVFMQWASSPEGPWTNEIPIATYQMTNPPGSSEGLFRARLSITATNF